jgi:hypothetical protein
MIGLHFLTALADIYYGRINLNEVKYIAVSCYNPYDTKNLDENHYCLFNYLEFGCEFFSRYLLMELQKSKSPYTPRIERNRLFELVRQLERENKLVFVQEHPIPTFDDKGFRLMKKHLPWYLNCSKIPIEGVWTDTENISWLSEPLKEHKALLKQRQKRSFNLLKKIVSLIRFFSLKKYRNMNFKMKFWNKDYFQEFFEMSNEDFESLKSKGRIGVQMNGGKEVVDIDAIFLPPKFKKGIEKLKRVNL